MRSIEIPQPADRDWRYRSFEILPGAISWTVLSAPFILGLLSAEVAAYFAIAYLLTWFARGIAVDVSAMRGWRTMNQHKKLPWEKLNQDLEDLTPKTKNAPAWHFRNIARVEKYMSGYRMKPSEIYHAVIIAFVNEPQEIVEPTVQSVLAGEYDMKKVILVLAYEGRGGQPSEDLANYLIKKYGSHFYHAMAIKHPANMPGEIIGKGGNVTFAGRELKKYIDQEKIDPLRILVTTLDCDNRPDPKYLGALTYTYCSTEDPKHASYQPITMYLNNIWDAPAPMRVIASGNSFFNVTMSMRPHMLRNFSAHAQPLAALIDTDFWSVRTIVEDGHQFWRTYFRYDSNHQVFPIYIPIYQDAVLTDSYKRTLKAQFIQIRRWAYGASDIAYFANQAFIKKNKIPRHKLFGKFFRLLEGHISWATMPLILLLAAYPALFLHPQSYLANQLPHLASWLQRIAMAGILISLFVAMRSLPPKPARYKHRRIFWMIIQWIYMFITPILYNAFAALNSQTRLMFGWYLGKFDLTEKAIKSERANVSDM